MLPEAVPPARRSLSSYVQSLTRFGSREACLWRDGARWRRRTYAELQRRVLACAAALRSTGLARGDAVLIQGPDGADWVEALLGILWAGGVAVPLDAAAPLDLRARIATKAGARLLVSPAGIEAPAGVLSLRLGSWGEGATPESTPPADTGPADRAEVLFTSGTTGDPKGVILTHGNLISDFAAIERGYFKRERLVRLAGPLRVLSTLPLSHMFGQAMNVFLALTMGATVIYVPARPRDVLESARGLRAWGLFTVPRLLDLLGAEVRRAFQDQGRLETLLARQERFARLPFYLQAPLFWRVQRMFGWRFRLLVSGGAALPEQVDAFWRRSGYLLIQGYGLTETAPIISISNPFDRRPGSVGRPLAIQEVRLGEGNELLVRGPNVTSGYLGEKAETGDGWFRTGDVGEIDERGRLRIRGRLKEVIVTPEGENVHPADVEGAFDGIAGVRSVAVVGLPMERGEQVHAALVLDPGTDPLEAVGRANGRLLPKQRVRGHTVWPEDDLPRTSTGKVRRGVVRDRALALERQESAAGAASAEAGSGGVGEVRRLLAGLARVRPESLQGTTRLVEGLGFGSLDLVELAAAFEENLGVVVPEDRLGESTVGDLEDLVRSSVVTGGRGIPPSPAAAPSSGDGETGARIPAAPAPQSPPPPRGVRGVLRMPRWTRSLPMRAARRAIEEGGIRPFVRFYARPAIAGLEHLGAHPPPYLFVPNHRSYMDTGLFKAMLPGPLRGRIAPGMTTRYHRVFFGETSGGSARYLKEALQVRLVEFFFNAWPVPETAGIRASLSYAGELMDAGYSILIFPEGRHVPPPALGVFRKGIGIFARELRAPVVPVWIEGTEGVLPDGVYWPRLGRTRLILGPPLLIDADADAGETTRRLEAAVAALRPANG